jgi:hypothetical protein
MDYTSDPTTNQHPNSHDYEELEIIYSHLDSTTTVSQASAASRGDLNSRAEWGRKMRESRDGKIELWAHGFGNGYRVFTFVRPRRLLPAHNIPTGRRIANHFLRTSWTEPRLVPPLPRSATTRR